MLYDAATNSLVLQVDDPFAVLGLIPKSRTLQHPDYNLAVQHTLAATKVLRNIGVAVPAPILTSYKWPGCYLPMEQQEAMAEFYTLNRRGFNLSEPGTGKTAATLWAADWLMRQGYVQKALILAPLSTLERVWQDDIFSVLMHRVVSVVHGSRDVRKQRLEANASFYVMNHEGVRIGEIRDILRKRADIDLVIVDEGSKFRNSASAQYKGLEKLLRPDQRLWWLTGTPCPNEPPDAWAQARLINPSKVPKFFGAFKAATMIKVSTFKWVPRVDAYNMAFEAMQPAIRFKKADCMDLPPVIPSKRQAELTVEQKAAFGDMRKKMIMESKGGRINAVNAADQLGKLRQILCGSIKDPVTDKYIEIPHGPRAEVLMEIIREAVGKVLVIVPYKGILESLEREVAKEFTVDVLNGDVTTTKRNRIIENFKTTPDPHVLLCHPQVMSHGLNMTEADTTVFYAPIYSNDQFAQVIERMNRAGQTRPMRLIKMAAHPLEWEIYKLLDNRMTTQDNILKLYRSIIT